MHRNTLIGWAGTRPGRDPVGQEQRQAMARRDLLNVSLVAALCALALIGVMLVLALAYDPHPSQERFEVVSDPEAYASALRAGADGLRAVLFVDSLFLLAYATAIGFAALAFAGNCRAAAWVGGLGILLVAALDMFENTTMVQSLDMALISGGVALDRIAFLASISAIKWQVAAATLLAISFVLPSAATLEKVLVWGVRLGLPVAVPLFVHGAFGLREAGGLALLVSMAGGFVLLALLLRAHAGEA